MMLSLLIYILGGIAIATFIVACYTVVYLLMYNHIQKAKKDIEVRNNALSCAYFFMDMGPNTSSVAIIAIVIMPPEVSLIQLVLVFILGVLLKRFGRIFIKLYMKKMKVQYKQNDFAKKLITEMKG